MTRTYHITHFPSLVRPQDFSTKTYTWPHVVEYFSGSLMTPLAHKKTVPLFGGYALTGPQRRDSDVSAISLAVFDVDQNTDVELNNTLGLLLKADLKFLVYSTLSHDPPTKYSYRLILPLARDIPPTEWKSLRQRLIEKYQISVDPKTSSGVSHSYFKPSHQKHVTPFLSFQLEGKLVRVGAGRNLTSPIPRALPITMEDDVPLLAPPDLTSFRNVLSKKAVRLRQVDLNKSLLLTRLLEGEPLAPSGSRNNETLRTAGMVAWCFPDTASNVLLELFQRSLEKMQADGSQLTEEQVYRMLVTARQHRKQDDAQTETIKQYWQSQGNRNSKAIK